MKPIKPVVPGVNIGARREVPWTFKSKKLKGDGKSFADSFIKADNKINGPREGTQ